MYKQCLLALSATAALLGPVAASAQVTGGTGTIDFIATVTQAPCSIMAPDLHQTIDLGQISILELDGVVGKTSLPVPITIHLKNCAFKAVAGATTPPANSKVGIIFSNGIINGDTQGHVRNMTGNDTLDIQLLHDDLSPVNFVTSGAKSGTGRTQQLLGGPVNEINLFARLISTKASVIMGPVSGSVVYTMAYF